MSTPDQLHIDIPEFHIIDSFGFSSYGIRGKPGTETPESPGTPITPQKEFKYTNISDEMTYKLERIDKAYESIKKFEKSKDLENDAENVGTMIARMKWYKVYRTKYENIKIFGHFWMIFSDIIKIQAMLINQRKPKEIQNFIEEVFIKGYFVLAYECWGEQKFQEYRTAYLNINAYYEIERSEIFIDMHKEIVAIDNFINIMSSIYVDTNANGVNPRTKTFFEQIPEGADLTNMMDQCRKLSIVEDIFEMDNESGQMNKMEYYLKFLKRKIAEIAELNNIDVGNKNNVKRKNSELEKYYYEMHDKEVLIELLNQLKEEMKRKELETKKNEDLDILKKFKESKSKLLEHL
ncbi:9824_t:CDS:2 [Gigaspora rosea]|nr:9824_t:CDS:2 [Gigaspora rosea]